MLDLAIVTIWAGAVNNAADLNAGQTATPARLVAHANTIRVLLIGINPSGMDLKLLGSP